MTENKLKTWLAYIAFIFNALLITYILLLSFVYNIFDADSNEMLVTIIVILPLVTVYLPLFISHINNSKNHLDDRSTKISLSSSLFYILILVVIFTAITFVITLKALGYIENFSTLINTIGLLETSLGISIGMIIQSLFVK